MAQPLYFLPNVTWTRDQSLSVSRKILQERGLAEIFADVDPDDLCVSQLAGRGPGELSGTIIYYKSPVTDIPRRIGFFPTEQKWEPVGDGSQVWIGLDTASPPTAEDLQRSRLHQGYPLELGNGQKWTIPVIRRPDGSTGLPTKTVITPLGLREPIKEAYQRYWDASERVLPWVFGEGLRVEDKLDAVRLAIQALSINYRIGIDENNLIDAIDSESFFTVLAFSVDLPRVQLEMQNQKKT